MKRLKRITTLLTAIICASLLLCACNANTGNVSDSSAETALVNGTAVYETDTELGEGAKLLTLSVTDADGETIVFTIHSDANTVGAALLENNLIAGDESEYGLYVKTVNGDLADYDVDAAYWGFYQNGEYMMTGVDATELTDGAAYELVYTK